MAGFSGTGNGFAALAVQSEVRDAGIYFAVQGNILESDAVVLDAVAAFLAEDGTVVDRVMAGMEAADRAGGDSRCSCRTDPVPETEAGCRHRTAHVAYVAAAKPEDPIGSGHSDGSYSLFIDVDDENTGSDESANPVETLRIRYDAWKASGGAGPARARIARWRPTSSSSSSSSVSSSRTWTPPTSACSESSGSTAEASSSDRSVTTVCS